MASENKNTNKDSALGLPTLIREPGKFQGELRLTECLYSEGWFDEECGSSSEGAGWYGLVRGPIGLSDETMAEFGLTDRDLAFANAKAGAILFERTDGFVEAGYYDDADLLETAWADAMEATADDSDDDDDDDYPSDHLSCDSCNLIRINGAVCHETGCPDSWKDHPVSCFECGCDFQPTERFQRVCEGCSNPFELSEHDAADAFGM